MIGPMLAFSAMVATAQAKAIITNNCTQPMYLWSVPAVGHVHTNNLELPVGARYEEPWRYGTLEIPGIALKISSEPNGISEGKPELNLGYSIDSVIKSEIWIDLSSIRGTLLDQVAFYSCQSLASSPHTLPHACSADTNVELVMCGLQRSSPAKDSGSLKQIQECYDYKSSVSNGTNHNSTKPYLFPNTTYTAPATSAFVPNTISNGPDISSYSTAERSAEPKYTRKYVQHLNQARPSIDAYGRHGSIRRDIVKSPEHCHPKVSKLDSKVKRTAPLRTVVQQVAQDHDGSGHESDVENGVVKIGGGDRGPQNRLSICDFCEPAVPGANCIEVWATLVSVFRLRGVDVKQDFLQQDWLEEDCKKHPSRPRKHNGKPAVCVKALCKRLAYKGRECERLEHDLTKAWDQTLRKTLTFEVDYTTDDDACGDH